MKKNILVSLVVLSLLVVGGIYIYPKYFSQKPQRTILYWTDPMIPGDRSNQSGKSPMGMERVPVYAEELKDDSARHQLNEYYTCPMHTSVHKDSPGVCPICGMTLVKKFQGPNIDRADQRDFTSVALSSSRQALANVETAPARRMTLQKEIHAVGKIDYAEPNLRYITMRYPGRLDKLHLTYVGQRVERGDPVAEVYSPEGISAQQEYLLAKDSYEEVKEKTDMIKSWASSLLKQSREKLLRWSFTEDQIVELERTREVKSAITMYSPINGIVLKKNVEPQQYAQMGEIIYEVADITTVWMYADLYEFDIQMLKMGQSISVTSDAYPDKIFKGRITFISPTLDPSSRTVQVRAAFSNPIGELKLESFVNVSIKVSLPSAIVVPASAVLSTGRRAIVWTQKQPGIFEPRGVELGARTEKFIQIMSGIDEGDLVVFSGGYLLDSESQLETARNSGAQDPGKMEMK